MDCIWCGWNFIIMLCDWLMLSYISQVLSLLKKAWERRLTFTIGTSVTTGELNTVVWNEIHHKTEFGSNHSGHGYPDPNYLDNVLAELSVHGVNADNWVSATGSVLLYIRYMDEWETFYIWTTWSCVCKIVRSVCCMWNFLSSDCC